MAIILSAVHYILYLNHVHLFFINTVLYNAGNLVWEIRHGFCPSQYGFILFTVMTIV